MKNYLLKNLFFLSYRKVHSNWLPLELFYKKHLDDLCRLQRLLSLFQDTEPRLPCVSHTQFSQAPPLRNSPTRGETQKLLNCSFVQINKQSYRHIKVAVST